VADSILNVFPALITKITSAVVEDITIFSQSLNNGGISHFMWNIKNLQVRKRTVNILKCKGLVMILTTLLLRNCSLAWALWKVKTISPED